MTDTKTCYACKETKNLADFYRRKDAHQKECKNCNRERKYKWHQSESGKLSSANTKLKRRFGIDLDTYNEMLKKQDYKCLICGATESHGGHRLAVDHDHETGQIRGLLCKSCNVGLGNFYDSTEKLLKAVDYLKTFGGKS